MTISRRGFIAGLALTGAAVPAAFYAHRELTRAEEFPITPGEATVDLADTAGQQLANSLRGVWSLRLEGRDAGLKGLPLQGLELMLDIAPVAVACAATWIPPPTCVPTANRATACWVTC